ncbi:MAG: hypothetical protein DPW09_45010 [Anaerolineae bacterium]|nr:hypothetical protein [Anaerolineae bacterium]
MSKILPVSRGIETHPYLVSSLAELPSPLQAAARQALAPTEQPHHIFLVPPQSFFRSWLSRRYVPPQGLLFTAQGVLHVQEAASPGEPAQATYLRGDDLLYVQLRLLLLYGRLELVGLANGALTRVVVEFNTVGFSKLQSGLRQLLPLTWGAAKLETSDTLDKTLSELDELPLKFKNGLRLYGLQPDECLLGVIFQRSLWKRYGRVLPHQVSANTLLALTDHELVIIEEEKTDWKNPYGWILTFCPLACLKEFETMPEGAWQELQLRLARKGVEVERRVKLGPETALNWQELWSHYHIGQN